MKVGSWTGCHQITERSFSLHGYQFPVCARCTGILLGELLSLLALSAFFAGGHLNWYILLALLSPLVIDGVTQHLKLRTSNNILRLATGILFGLGLVYSIVALLNL
ncbi:MAG: DUF2085 domain-containing protein [Propionibacteriaceae bacterium]|nr:DUF2085 domain-containing protein [Propionibacteriaceae bacterium]